MHSGILCVTVYLPHSPLTFSQSHLVLHMLHELLLGEFGGGYAMYMYVCILISGQNNCMGGGSVVTVSDLCASNLDFRQLHVNFVSMYMGLVIELVGGMFMHFSLHSYAALIYHWHTLQLYMYTVSTGM